MRNVILKNQNGLLWEIVENEDGYVLGHIFFHNEQIEAPVSKGILCVRNIETGEEMWLPAQTCIASSSTTARLGGRSVIESSVFVFTLELELVTGFPAARMNFSWSVDKSLEGWEVCLMYQDGFMASWNGHVYPWEEDSKFIQQSPLTYVGIPSSLFYQDDFSLGILFGIDPKSDYLNPLSWTGTTGLHFTDGRISPRFRICGKGLDPRLQYTLPLQVIFNDSGHQNSMVTGLVKDWIGLNKFRPEPLFVRSPQEALRIFLDGRRQTSSWKASVGYRLEVGDPNSSFVYLGEQPFSAYFEYRVYEITRDEIWRQRCFEQMDFVLLAQNTDPSDRHFGAFHTAYDLWKNDFDSNDRGNNIGYKPDLNAYMARYILQTWQRVKEQEEIDRQDWYQAAVLAADWVMRQRNPDGGLPQKVNIESSMKSLSATSGRALPAMPIIGLITGDQRYTDFGKSLESYLVNCVENRMRFTGHHPDLPPEEIEEASIYGVIEYWLNEYEQNNRPEALEHALADTYLSILWWCPKQLSWVKNPTQCASAEQLHFLQYSIYCYQNRKIECLKRLARITNDNLWQDLFDRVLQGIFWTQITEGDQMGATHERIADPWLVRQDGASADFNSLGSIYIGEQSLDTMLQLLEMGYKPS